MTNSALSLASRFKPADVIAARRELAKRSLSDFACMVDIPTAPITSEDDEDSFSTIKLNSLADHHKLLCDKLHGVADGTIPNLMVLMPPGSAKSTYVDVVFIPWFMAKYPRRNVGLGSYASNLAKKQGRRARQLIRSKSYSNLFPGVGLTTESSAADEFKLTTGGEFMAGGLLSGITGNRFHLGVLDDPIAGREEAESETIRNKTWEAYVDDFCSRLTPGAPQVMILTRWHQADPAGRILPENWDGESGWFDGRDGRKWYVICLPAIADRLDDPLERKIGETLWPEWFSHAHWEPFKRNPRTWSSLYQQKPSPEEGTFFKREWFKRYAPDELPKRLNIYMTSDHAPGGKQTSDFNTFRVWGLDSRQHLWLLDGYKVQGTIDKAMGIELDESGEQKLLPQGALPLIKKWKPMCWFPEDDNNWKSAAPFITAAMRRARVMCRVEPISPHGADKATKAQPFQAKAAMGEVHFPVGFETDEILKQYLQFPAGSHDDEVDNGANIGRALDEAHPAIVPPEEAPSGNPADLWSRTTEPDKGWMSA
jgi:hypothetical protein